MRKQVILTIFTLTLAFVLCEATSAANDTWINETVANSSSISGNSLALDSSGNPHISYHEDGGDVKYAYKDDSGWHIINVDSGVTEDVTSIALDSSDRPHITYTYTQNGLKSIIYAYDDGSKHAEIALKGEGDYYSSVLALDSSGNPHISCAYLSFDGTNFDLTVKYAYKDGSGWHVENAALLYSDTTYPYPLIANSLALDSSGNPHISYYSPFTHHLEYAYKDGSGWHYDTVDNSAGDTSISFGYTSLALDSSGNPHIGYSDNLGNLKYARTGEGPWIIEIVDSPGLAIYSPSLALDSSNNPHISYYIAEILRYAVKSEGIWTIETLDAGYHGNGWRTFLVLDPSDNPHISYSGRGYDFDENSFDYLRYIYVPYSGNPTNPTNPTNPIDPTTPTNPVIPGKILLVHHR